MKSALLIYVFLMLFKMMLCQDPLVMTIKGLVRGWKAADGNYSTFLGIPYALVNPENPFGYALPLSTYSGIFNAYEESPACPQASFETGETFGSLDCLTVNVYVPSSANSNNRLPVMVWFHGGRFEGGSSSSAMYGPQYIVRHEVILVTLNYRLGPYGFMCLDIPSVPGNTGLKDQQFALRWVHDNIGAFGGDVEKVTIFGQSAGGGSCEYHILNPTSNELFSQAILHSGTVFTDGIIEESRTELPLELAAQLGFEPSTVEDALDALIHVNPNHLISAGIIVGAEYRPCIEKKFDGVEGFITGSPESTLQSKEYRKIPMIIGYTSSETINSERNKDIHDTLKSRFNFSSEIQFQTALKIVRDFYIGHEISSEEDLKALVDFDSDFTNNYGAEKSILYHLEQSSYPVYQYVFGYLGSHSSFPAVGHTEDLHYLFKVTEFENSPSDQQVIDKFSTLWTNFAKYGNPTPEMNELLPVRWPAVSTDLREYLWIDSELRIGQNIFHDRMAFWKLFFAAYGEYFWITHPHSECQCL